MVDVIVDIVFPVRESLTLRSAWSVHGGSIVTVAR